MKYEINIHRYYYRFYLFYRKPKVEFTKQLEVIN